MRPLALAMAAVLLLAAVATRAGVPSPRHLASANHAVQQSTHDTVPGQTTAPRHATMRAVDHRLTPTIPSPPPAVPRVVLGAATGERVVALTFDLDMTPSMAAQVRAGASWYNADAVAYLRAQHVHATLFMTGLWAEMYPGIARQLAQDADFEIGNHTYSHPAFHAPCYRLGWVGRAAQAEQVRMAQQAILWATGVTPRYFRFPGGCYDAAALDLVHAAGLIPVQWNVNSIDAFNPYSAQVSAAVLTQVKPGSIVIMHLQGGANAPSTGAALRLIVPALERRGYQFVTISQLLATGPAVQPTDAREVVEATPPPLPTTTPPILATPKPSPRSCGWVLTRKGWVWVCR